MDYDGNISEALQVSNSPPVPRGDCWGFTDSQGMQKNRDDVDLLPQQKQQKEVLGCSIVPFMPQLTAYSVLVNTCAPCLVDVLTLVDVEIL